MDIEIKYLYTNFGDPSMSDKGFFCNYWLDEREDIVINNPPPMRDLVGQFKKCLK